ncbi:hypothetical protein SLE2022_278660 [Rubroshorea leprosula]
MDLATRRFDFAEPFGSPSKCACFGYSSPETSANDDDNIYNLTVKALNITDLETGLFKSIIQDDKARFVVQSNKVFKGDSTTDRSLALKLLLLCCLFDAVDCATALVNGELGVVPVVNEVDPAAGMTALHTAAEAHSARCVELLLKRRARTDLRSKDGRALLALMLSLSSSRLDVIWNPDDYSVEDLVVLLSEKDLTTVKLLTEKTKEIDQVAYAVAIGGKIAALAVLLIVAADKVNQSTIVLHDADSGSKEKATIYECVIGETLSLGRDLSPGRAAKRTCTPTKSEAAEKRKLLLREIELLHLFDAVAQTSSLEKKPTSPLILAIKAGDEAVIELLLKRNIDVNDADDDAEGNSALHWSLRRSWGSSSQQIKILCLLLNHGARVNQRNKLELTAFHIAACNGNSQALQILLLEDPDGINYKTLMKETPLFFAVKNDHIDCAELLLRWGANSEVLNLRRERPIDLATSQDMRFMLNPTNINLMNRAFPERNLIPSLLGDEVILDTCEALLAMTDEEIPTERICSNTKTEICKYFESPSGCVRGSKCFYAHGKEELRPKKQGMHIAHALKRRIFVGGLPPSLDSDFLHKFFEQQFGLVEDAHVARVQAGDDQIQSRGFGFVTFKHEKSVLQAVQAHYVTIMGKQVEIKSAVQKCVLQAQSQKLSPREQELNNQHVLQLETTREKNVDKILTQKTSEEAESEKISWLGRLLNGETKTPSPESEADGSSKSVNWNIPIWLKTFKKWFPSFLQEKHRKEGQYSLSSLKADFRAAFGLELDHASLGYLKLSDFMRSFPNLCHIKEVSVGGQGHANHMLLLPILRRPHQRLLKPIMHCQLSSAASLDDITDTDSDGTECLHDPSDPCENVSVTNSNSKMATLQHEVPAPENDSGFKDTVPDMSSRFLQFLMPGSFMLFNTQPPPNKGNSGANDETGGVEGMNERQLWHQQRHMVLESLARRRNSSSVFFLREYDFYKSHKASIRQGKCFWCNQNKLLWSNFPCQHQLWCSDCKILAARASGNYEHRCVVCDRLVQKFLFVPSDGCSQCLHGDAPNHKEFSPIDSSHFQIASKNSPLRNFSGSIEEKINRIHSEKAYNSIWSFPCAG